MTIELKKLSIINFKGIHSLEIIFRHITNVFGDNATGKTTIFDAFLWLFFGKNSEDISQFEVKRLDEKNRFIKDIEAEVEAVFQIDDREISAKKILRQKWVKRRGEPLPNYQGDENVYFWNDVPLKESEFKAKTKAIIDEVLFKLITNPFYFNSLKWQDRRNILIELSGNISDNEVFDTLITPSNKDQYTWLINALNQKKTIDEIKRELASKKKKIKDEADGIPSRIDEVRRGMPDQLDFENLRAQLATADNDLSALHNTLNNEVLRQQEENKRRAELLRGYNKDLQDRQQKIFSIKTRMQNIEFEVKQQARDAGGKLDAEIISITRQITDKQLDYDRYTRSIAQIEGEILSKEDFVAKLRNQYVDEDAKTIQFNDTEFVCPSCKQALPDGDVKAKKEELIKNFNTNKFSITDSIVATANATKQDIQILKQRVANGNEIIAQLGIELTSLKTKLSELQQQALMPKDEPAKIVADILYNHAEYKQLTNDLAATDAIVLTEPVFAPQQTNAELDQKQKAIQATIYELQKQLNNEALIKKAEERILELQSQESLLSKQLTELEGTEFAIMQFTKAKVDAIEKRINGKFSMVKFKLFSIQVNGGEVECCETLVPGPTGLVPFSDANNAARINSGIDIINTLCKHYDVRAPIFIDNRESITRLIESGSQIVNLIVSEADKKLRVA